MRDMLPVLNGVHGGDWIACEIVSPGYPGMGGSCIASIVSSAQLNRVGVPLVSPEALRTGFLLYLVNYYTYTNLGYVLII